MLKTYFKLMPNKRNFQQREEANIIDEPRISEGMSANTEFMVYFDRHE